MSNFEAVPPALRQRRAGAGMHAFPKILRVGLTFRRGGGVAGISG